MTWNSTAADGMLKRRYGDMVDLIPESSLVRKKVKWSNAERAGDGYFVNVEVQRSHGWTLQSGASSFDAFTLNAVRTGKTLPANLTGSTFVMRESFGYKMVVAAFGEGESAFASVFDTGVKSILSTANLIQEILLLYGTSPTGIGTFAAAGVSATTDTHELTLASSCMSMMIQLENAAVDVYDPTLATKRNTNGALVIGSVQEVSGTVSQVQFTLTGAAADNAAVQSGDYLVLRDAVVNGTMSGIDKIATNSGSLFGISAATYPQWKANAYSAGSARLNFGKLTAASIPIALRSPTRTAAAIVPYTVWADLNNDAAAIRRDTENKGRVEFGAKEIRYFGPSGELTIEPHSLLKNGEAFILDWDSFRRVGESDVAWTVPGVGQNQKMLRELADSAGFEIRCMWDQAILCERPRSMTKITDIVSSTA